MNLRFLFYLASWLCILANGALADELRDCQNHSTTPSSNLIAPVLSLDLAPSPITSCSAVSFLGEIGPTTYRAGATAGAKLRGNYFKLSGEFLGQKMKFNFSSGQVKRWISQYAVGGAYQFRLSECGLTCLNLNIGYARAYGQNLRPIACIPGPEAVTSVLYRHITGGRDTRVGAGVTLAPWRCATIALTADWDYLIYKRSLLCTKKATGFGGTIDWHQSLPAGFLFDIKAQMLRPYYYLEGALGWSSCLRGNLFDIRLFGGYTKGRFGLFDSTVVGLSINIAFGSSCGSSCYFPTCGMSSCCTPCPCTDAELLAWVAAPAIYMPTVLAIAEEKRVDTLIPPPCFETPVVLPDYPGVATFTVTGGTFNFGQYIFSTTPILSYGTSAELPPDFVIDQNGIITFVGEVPTQTLERDVVLTVVNRCGSTPVPLRIILQGTECNAPMPTQDFPNPIIFNMTGASVDLAPFVTGTQPITFSAVLPPNFTLTPEGVITWTGPNIPIQFQVMITLTNRCAATTVPTTLLVTGPCVAPTVAMNYPGTASFQNTGDMFNFGSFINGTLPISYGTDADLPPNFTINNAGVITYTGPAPMMMEVFQVTLPVSNDCGEIMVPLELILLGPDCIPVSQTSGIQTFFGISGGMFPQVLTDFSTSFSGTPPLTYTMINESPPGQTYVTLNSMTGVLTYVGGMPIPPPPNEIKFQLQVSNCGGNFPMMPMIDILISP